MSYVQKPVWFDGKSMLMNWALQAPDADKFSVSLWVTVSEVPGEDAVQPPDGRKNATPQIFSVDAREPYTQGYVFAANYLPTSSPFHINDIIALVLSADRSQAVGADFAAYAEAGDYPFDVPIHYLYSCDTSVFPPKQKLYINDVDVTFDESEATSPFLIAFLNKSLSFGGDILGYFNKGSLADVWFAPGVSLLDGLGDIPVGTRRLFIDGTGAPTDPAGFPAGAAVLLTGDASQFARNQGSGGPFQLFGQLSDRPMTTTLPPGVSFAEAQTIFANLAVQAEQYRGNWEQSLQPDTSRWTAAEVSRMRADVSTRSMKVRDDWYYGHVPDYLKANSVDFPLTGPGIDGNVKDPFAVITPGPTMGSYVATAGPAPLAWGIEEEDFRGVVPITGKRYFSAKVTHWSDEEDFSIGLVNPAYDMVSNSLVFLGQANSFGIWYTVFNNSHTALPSHPGWAHAVDSTCDVAVDSDLHRLWYRVNGGAWNGSTAAAGDPETGAGGIDISSLGPSVYPAFAVTGRPEGHDVPPGQMQVEFGPTFTNAMPAGYMAYNDTGPTTDALWLPGSGFNAIVALSSDRLTAAAAPPDHPVNIDTSIGGNQTVKAGRAITSAEKKFFSVKLNSVSLTGGYNGMGIVDAAVDLTVENFVGDVGGCCLTDNTNGLVLLNDVATGGAPVPHVGSTVDICVNGVTKHIWFRVDGGLWNNGPADPAADTGGIDFNVIGAGPWYPAVSLFGFPGMTSPTTMTANFKGPFSYAVPAGFTPLG